MKTEPLPPNSPEAEAALIGMILNGQPEVLPAVEQLDPDAFFDLRYRKVFEAALDLHRAGQSVEVASVWLASGKTLEAATLAQMAGSAPSATGIGFFVDQLRGLHQQRLAGRTLVEAQMALAENPAQAVGILRHAVEALQSLAPKANSGLTIRQPDDLLALPLDDSDILMTDRIMATGQSFVFCGAGSLGKSRLLLQLIVASITGRLFLAFETSARGKKWLLLQAENSNRRLIADLLKLRAWIGDDWPLVNEALRIHTLESDADGILNLDQPETCAFIAKAIAEFQPDVVAFDSLYNFAIGDLNADRDMAATLLTLSRLARAGNPDRAIVVLHHAGTGRVGASRATGYDRASFGRNSKVLHSWTRAQLNVAPGSPDNNDVLVISCGKNSNGREFPPFAIRLDPETMIYTVDPNFDLAAWQAEVSGKDSREPLMTVDRVRELCQPKSTKAELSKAIMEDCGCIRQSSYRFIKRAEKARKIKLSKSDATYSPA